MEYNYVTLQCRLSDYDRRTPVDDFKPIDLVDAQGIDYFENLCLEAESSCEDQRGFSTPRIGVPDQKIALHVNVHFYTDKELMVRRRLRERKRIINSSSVRPIVPPPVSELARSRRSFCADPICTWDLLMALSTTAGLMRSQYNLPQ